MLPPYFRSPQTPDIKVYMDICMRCSSTLYLSSRSSLIQVFFSYLIFFLHSFLIDFEHLCIGHSVRCWMDCMAPEYLSMRLVICIWIIYLVHGVFLLGQPHNLILMVDSNNSLSLSPSFLNIVFHFLFFLCICYIVLLVAIWDFLSNHNHVGTKLLCSTWEML